MRGVGIKVCGALEQHCVLCVCGGIVGSSLQLRLVMKHLEVQTQEVTVLKAWSLALRVQRLGFVGALGGSGD